MAHYEIQKNYPISSLRVNFNSPQSSFQLIPPSGVGFYIVVDQIIISTQVIGDMIFGGPTTATSAKFFMAANSTIVMSDLVTRLQSNGSLTITTSMTGNHSVYVEYHTEGGPSIGL